MTLLEFTQQIQQSDVAVMLRASGVAYPLILTSHLAGIALFGGMVVAADLRLMGVWLTDQSVSEVVGQTRTLKWFGFAVVLICGLLMACSKAEEYYYNAFFRSKMVILAMIAIHGLVFRGVYRNTAALDGTKRMPARAKLAGGLSLLLWTAMIIAGRGIGYIEPPLDKIHAWLHAPIGAERLLIFETGQPGHGTEISEQSARRDSRNPANQ